MKKRKKIGLVLGSGGAKGLAHIGVIEELKKNKIQIDCIAGSSIGALIGAHYALHKNISHTRDLFFQNDWKTLFNLFDPSLRSILIKGEKIEKFLNNVYKNKNFSDLQIPFFAVATDIAKGESFTFSSGKIAKAVRASISVPAVFAPFTYKNKIFIDGGVSNPLPVNALKNCADLIVAVNLDTNNFDDDFHKNKINLSSVSARTINILRYQLAKKSLKEADILLEPKFKKKMGFVGWKYFFKQNEMEDLIKSGRQAIKKSLIYFK